MHKSAAIKFLSLSVMVYVMIASIACKKKTNEVDSETQSVVDNSICEQEFMQIHPTVYNLAVQTKGTGAKKLMAGTELLSGCDTLAYVSGDTTYSNLGMPPKFEFNYSNCTAANHDGIGRSGIIAIQFFGKPKLPGTKSLITMLNYQVNKPAGSVTFTCDSMVIKAGIPTSTVRDFTVSVHNAVCTGTGWVIKYSSVKTITINNNGTPLQASDDVITVSGTSSGTNRNGKTFDVVINSITKPFNCKYITSGTVDVTPEGLNKRTVDYGSGTCDDDATFTVNGQTIAFKLK